MTFQLPTVTPFAEYFDMLYTRLWLALQNDDKVDKWWLEAHPMPHGFVVGEGGKKPAVGYVDMKAMVASSVVSYRATFTAAELGAQASTEVLETVVEHHIHKFVEVIKA